MNVLTQQKRNTVETLLGKGVSQHEIHRKTGIDRKTIRKIARRVGVCEANSPMYGSPLQISDTSVCTLS